LVNTYEGPVTFPQIGFTDQGTITDWDVSGLAPVIKTVTYARSDLDFIGAFGSGFRWAETVVNTGTSAWSDFHISLIDISGTASGSGNFLNTPIATSEVPGFASITGASITVLSTLGTPIPILGWVMTLSPDQRTIDMVFPTPILPGQSFQVHIPIVNLGDGGGVFVLSERATVTPEPATWAMWLILGAIGLTVSWFKQKKRKQPLS
jgi:hypothetical protein